MGRVARLAGSFMLLSAATPSRSPRRLVLTVGGAGALRLVRTSLNCRLVMSVGVTSLRRWCLFGGEAGLLPRGVSSLPQHTSSDVGLSSSQASMSSRKKFLGLPRSCVNGRSKREHKSFAE